MHGERFLALFHYLGRLEIIRACGLFVEGGILTEFLFLFRSCVVVLSRWTDSDVTRTTYFCFIFTFFLAI